MKAVLDYLSSRLVAIAVVLILLYIGYNELFRKSSVSNQLDQALTEIRLIQANSHYLETQLKATQKELTTAENRLTMVDGKLGELADSVSATNARYQAEKAKWEQSTAVALDRYNQQKKHIEDIQKQIR